MSGDLSLHIIHASVAYLDVVCVADFLKRMSFWEGLSYDSQELFSYVGLYILTEGGLNQVTFLFLFLVLVGVFLALGSNLSL